MAWTIQIIGVICLGGGVGGESLQKYFVWGVHIANLITVLWGVIKMGVVVTLLHVRVCLLQTILWV